ncbi:MAG: hypothetical protein P9M00_00060 [Candidatus Tritonobacter lacicola]|nr:hypothetical protein [Candidatus Tritonobacter lacicola]
MNDSEKILSLLQEIKDYQSKLTELFNSYLEKYMEQAKKGRELQREYIEQGKRYEESQKAYRENLKKSEFRAKIRLVLLSIVAIGILLNLFL